MKSFLIVLFGCALTACVSEGAYFQLDELRRMVRERQPVQRLVDRHGPPTAQYPDDIFTRSHDSVDSSEPQLVTTEVDEAVFFGLDTNHPDNYDYHEERPFARASFQERPTPTTFESRPASLQPHLGEAFAVNHCEGKIQALKYHARRNDPNGYVETQYTMFLVDQNWRICGFQVRSHFAAR